MSQLRLNFLNWRPDIEDTQHDGLSIAQNVLHDTEGYKEVRAMNTGVPLASSSLNVLQIAVAPFRGAVSATVTSVSDNRGYFAAAIVDPGATATVLQAGLFDGWTGGYAATATGAHYSTTSLQAFEFAELNDKGVMSVRHHNYAVTGAPQGTTTALGYFDRTSGIYGQTFTAVSGSWVDGIAYGPAVVANVGQFVMGGNLVGGANGLPYSAGVQWSAIGDATVWPIPETDDARSKQAGYEQLPPRLGEVTHIAGDDFFGYVFQQEGITKFTYVGGDVVFQVDTFEESRGAYSFNHVVRVDNVHFFESKYGRHALSGGQIVDIGEGEVNDTYPPLHTNGTRIKANPAIHTVFFTNGCAYNYQTSQWTYTPTITPIFDINDSAGIIGQYLTGSGTTTLTNSSGGTAQTATITTAAPNINTGGRAVVTGVRPIANGGTYSVRVGRQDNINDAVSWSTATSVNSRSNMANFRSEGRYHRAELTVTGGFTTIMGADIDVTAQGKV